MGVDNDRVKKPVAQNKPREAGSLSAKAVGMQNLVCVIPLRVTMIDQATAKPGRKQPSANNSVPFKSKADVQTKCEHTNMYPGMPTCRTEPRACNTLKRFCSPPAHGPFITEVADELAVAEPVRNVSTVWLQRPSNRLGEQYYCCATSANPLKTPPPTLQKKET